MTSGPTVVLRVPIFYMRVVGRAGIPGWTAPEKQAARSGRGAGRVHPVGARLTVSTTAATPSAACSGLALTTSEITTSEITTCGIDFVDPAGTPVAPARPSACRLLRVRPTRAALPGAGASGWPPGRPR
jgi:hypothetical protein